MVCINDDYSDTETYVDSSDESEYSDGDEVIITQVNQPIYCACCEEWINRMDFYLHIEETNEFICEDCYENASADVDIDADYDPAEQTEQ